MASSDDVQDSPSLDHIPLSQRRESPPPNSTDSHSQNNHSISFSSTPPIIASVEEECDSQVAYSKIQNDDLGVAYTSSSQQCSTIGDAPVTAKVEDSDDLDHVVLKERQRMLLARRLPGLPSPAFEDNSECLFKNIVDQTVEKENGDFSSVDGKITAARDQCHDIPEGKNTSLSELPHEAPSGSSLSTEHATPKSRRPVISAYSQGYDQIVKSEAMITHSDSQEEQGVMPINNNGASSSACPASVKIKDEPWDNSEIHNVIENAMCSSSIKLPVVKNEQEVHNDYNDDQVEHMILNDRLKFLMSREDCSLSIPISYPVSSSNFSESAEPSRIKCARKRKKTATNSIKTALEEDAPGLLEVLLDEGVSVDEIKLYGETENDEALDESLCQDSFSEFEAVITKIFSQRDSFIKFPVIRAGKGSKENYCMASLISLVEQTRCLKLQKSPVEWGWCRDLQSFIFVFHMHNRIVLERPEYGYATYFFELLSALPVEWQIKRLVLAMKLTTCSRISIIENKTLTVGEDLAEGEAEVLKGYGWIPNTGLGTMLNYRDRVVHDRKNADTSEWRVKIGKLLMNGYLGGTTLTPDIPKRVADYMSAQNPNIDSSSLSDE